MMPPFAFFPRLALAVLVLLAAGCSTSHGPCRCEGIDAVSPAQGPARIVHRAILTIRGRHYTLDGVLDIDSKGRRRLAVVSAMGSVTEIVQGPDGKTESVTTTALFQEAWSRSYVARDLRLLYPAPHTLAESSMEENGGIVGYLPETPGGPWRDAEICRDGRCVWRAQVVRRDPGTGWPMEFDVNAETYRLHLRVVKVGGASP